jgi:hypothetical protein
MEQPSSDLAASSRGDLRAEGRAPRTPEVCVQSFTWGFPAHEAAEDRLLTQKGTTSAPAPGADTSTCRGYASTGTRCGLSDPDLAGLDEWYGHAVRG